MSQHDEITSHAIEVAEKWLQIVDGGDYSGGWKEAASLMRKAVTEDQLTQSLSAVRDPLGKVESRSVETASYETTLPGAPDGEYVVIQFNSSFEHKKSAVETVTPMHDTDGEWRVSGYFIK